MVNLIFYHIAISVSCFLGSYENGIFYQPAYIMDGHFFHYSKTNRVYLATITNFYLLNHDLRKNLND